MHHNDERNEHEKGQTASHQTLDSKDEKSIKNRLAQAGKEQKEASRADKEAGEKPTEAAKKHGNQPSRGARIDEELEQDDRKTLERKGLA
jgi:hypothetical protein